MRIFDAVVTDVFVLNKITTLALFFSMIEKLFASSTYGKIFSTVYTVDLVLPLHPVVRKLPFGILLPGFIAVVTFDCVCGVPTH